MDTKVQTNENISTKKKKKIDEYFLDETIVKAGSEYIWLWVAIEPENKEILRLSISNKERNMFFVAEISFFITYCRIMWSTSCFNRDGGALGTHPKHADS